MNTLKSLIVAMVIAIIAPVQAQTADEIIANYFENTGGKENWEKLKGIEMVGVMKMQGMEIPFEQVSTKDGKQLITIELQGSRMIWSAFDGETSWTRNQMTMEAEKSDSEATDNMKKQTKDFPDPFLNYKEKGYAVELIGKETIDGTETFKVKLTKDPITIDGQSQPNITHYYFDTENFVPIIMESQINEGPMKGQTIKSSISDYQEVNGVYFPFTIGNDFQTMNFTEIKIDPEVDNTKFAFPEKK
ncbi:outer membrane lipoprotein-sorting protein [Aquimarina sp. 2201CG5-10]|uniref:outer membrane lipoprotein-sorting protein n=1 Tax=Aquimarina callyspongiae TaxID=3098150 RepID=UPI002AB4A4C2|nr:outer membrane lipoprotein-sorting protein [Aquimarina sp. 2201CG5-10]MDY8138320.1 outer membrane lipoprotein-sorting protein [Aquimarina sp. 2201CG5-10]